LKVCLEKVLELSEFPNADMQRVRFFLDAAPDALPRLPRQKLKRQVEDIQLGGPAGPHIVEALSEFVLARRSIRDVPQFVLMVWVAFHECVAAWVEADDAERNPNEWHREDMERDGLLSDGEGNSPEAKRMAMARAVARRISDQGRWSKYQQAWLFVADELLRLSS
jgi:hypothetical protein